MNLFEELSIVIPYRGDFGRRDQLLEWNVARLRSLIEDPEIILSDVAAPIFSRSGARNVGVQEASRKNILLLDADTVFPFGQLEEGLERLDAGAPWVIPYEWYYNLTEADSDALLATAPSVELVEPTIWEHKLVSWAGMALIRREDFIEIGGYDERFVGWGFEDNAFKVAADCILGNHERTDGNVQHLFHPRHEIENFGSPFIHLNRALYNRYERVRSNPDKMKALIAGGSSL